MSGTAQVRPPYTTPAVSDGDCPCCSGGGTCACPEVRPTGLRLVGYSDYDLTPCSDCANSSDTAWTGDFPNGPDVNQLCSWFGPLAYDISISGKRANSFAVPRIWLDTGAAVYYMAITCKNSGSNPATDVFIIWKGTRACSGGPAGTYTRTDGIDTTATLVVEGYTP